MLIWKSALDDELGQLELGSINLFGGFHCDLSEYVRRVTNESSNPYLEYSK